EHEPAPQRDRMPCDRLHPNTVGRVMNRHRAARPRGGCGRMGAQHRGPAPRTRTCDSEILGGPMSRTLTRLAAAVGVLALGVGLAGCQTDAGDAPASDYVTDGKLTVATGEPAYFPYVIDDAPESGEGF